MAKGFRSFEIAPPYLYWYYSTPFPVLQTLFLVTMTISFPPQQAYSTNPKPALPSDDGRAGLLGAADGMRRGGSSILVGSGVGVRVVVAAIFGPGTTVAKAACQILEILLDEE